MPTASDQRSVPPVSACAFAAQAAGAAQAAREPGWQNDRPEPGRALVATTTSGQAVATSARLRPSAVFLAHLIAVAQQAPQTRQRRRAEPDVAKAVYAEACAPPARTGGALCRSL
jgi:hypothetical protein